MKTVFYIDGGAGRIIAAIPSLLKYVRLNPTADFSIVVAAWDYFFWGFPELQDRTYSLDTKGVFDNILKKADKIITLEPYRNISYINQEISLSQAFDQEVNNTIDHADLSPPSLVLSKKEKLIATNTIEDLKNNNKKSKTVVFQSFGRGAKIDRGVISDEESRSLSSGDYLYLVKKLAQNYNMIFFGEAEFQLKDDTFAAKYTCDLRQWAALIKEADYFIGVDSVGQHMARAVGTPGSVIFGSTYPINTSYPDYFNIIDLGRTKKYSPIRLAGLDVTLANRLNEATMEFTQQDLDVIYDNIVTDIEKQK